MNNELFNHQKSDAVKWVCTLLAFLIVGVLIAGIICGWFDKKETPPTEQTETGFIVTHYGLNDIISRVQNGMTVTSETFPTVDMFRMEVKSGDEVTELYFCVNAEVVGITIDQSAIIF